MTIQQVPNTNRPRLSCRGSVTFLLPLCTTYLSSTGSISELTQEKIQEIEKQVNEENIKGIRVLGLAVRSLDQNQMEIVNKYKESLNSSSPSSASSSSSSSSSSSHPLISLESNFTFLGFFSFSDCLRVDAYYTIHKLRNAGIQIKCVSGDQLGTTTAIVQAVGINEKIENYHLGEYQEEENEDQYHYQNYNYDEEEKEEKKTQHRIIHVNSKPRVS